MATSRDTAKITGLTKLLSSINGAEFSNFSDYKIFPNNELMNVLKCVGTFLRGWMTYFNLSCFRSSRRDSLSCLLEAIIADASPSDIAL